jgi:hypothetical protein
LWQAADPESKQSVSHCAIGKDLRPVYTAVNAELAAVRFEELTSDTSTIARQGIEVEVQCLEEGVGLPRPFPSTLPVRGAARPARLF